MLLLTESDVRELLPMSELIDAMADGLARFSAGAAGGVVQPIRTVLTVRTGRDAGGFYAVMPAFLPEPPGLGTKLVTVFPGNHARGLPSHMATVLLHDPETGALVCVMDGRFITEARTAAVSAVSARLLARPDASTLAILGSGVQARSHLQAIPLVRNVREVRVWSPTAAHRDRFVAEMQPRTHVRVRACADAAEAAARADLIVVATSASDPVLRAEWVAPGAHVMSVGACRPHEREMDPRLVAGARLFVDSRAAALVESGDVVQGISERWFGEEHVAGEIGEVVSGTVQGRRSPEEITVFKSLGLAMEDVAAARLAHRRAREKNLGREWSQES